MHFCNLNTCDRSRIYLHPVAISELIIHAHDLIIRYQEIIIRLHDIIFRAHEITN